jgi:ribosomal protein S21
MIYAYKKPNESNERLISRFKKVVQRSRILDQKKNRYHAQKPTKKFTREAAIKRAYYRGKRDKEQYYS